MNLIIILQAGVASGTVLLFATIGEIFAERSGVLNLGVEGMMLIGAMSAFSVSVATGNPWLGLLVAMLVGGLLSQIHAFITINLQADQVVSGLALTFLGTGISLVLGEGLSKAGTISLLPSFSIPILSNIPFLGPIFFTNQNILVYFGYLFTPLSLVLYQPDPPGHAFTGDRRAPFRCGFPWNSCVPTAVFLRFCGGNAGRFRGSDDQPCNFTRLVQRAHDCRSGLDCGRFGNLCTVGSISGGVWLIYFWRLAPFDFGYSRPDADFGIAQSILLQSLLGFLPTNVTLRIYHCCAGDWITRGNTKTPGCARSTWRAVCSRRAW